MESSILTEVLLPLSLFIIMLGMGLSLVIDDFRRVFAQPKAALIGLTNQLILLPIIGFGLTQVIDLPAEFAIGLMLIAACPGGVTSNLISHVSRGDTALSISLTAMSSLISLLTIPLIVGFAFTYFNDTGQAVDVDEGQMLLQIAVIVIVPVAIGMFVRSRNAAFAQRMDRPVRIVSTVIFLVILLSIIIKERANIMTYLAQLGLVTGLLNILTMAVGFYSAKLFKLNLRQSITISIESGIQNGTLAIVIAMTALNNSVISIPPAVYSLLMFVSGGFMMYYFGRRKEAVEA